MLSDGGAALKRLLPAGRPPTVKPNAPEDSVNTGFILSGVSCPRVQTPRGTFSQLSAGDTVLLVLCSLSQEKSADLGSV